MQVRILRHVSWLFLDLFKLSRTTHLLVTLLDLLTVKPLFSCTFQSSRTAFEVIIHRDSGGQYLDGTCDTTRTVHFGHPTNDQSEAFTRVLQGHVSETGVLREMVLVTLLIRLLLIVLSSRREQPEGSWTFLPVEHFGKTV